jgi:hypothetical protein
MSNIYKVKNELHIENLDNDLEGYLDLVNELDTFPGWTFNFEDNILDFDDLEIDSLYTDLFQILVICSDLGYQLRGFIYVRSLDRIEYISIDLHMGTLLHYVIPDSIESVNEEEIIRTHLMVNLFLISNSKTHCEEYLNNSNNYDPVLGYQLNIKDGIKITGKSCSGTNENNSKSNEDSDSIENNFSYEWKNSTKSSSENLNEDPDNSDWFRITIGLMISGIFILGILNYYF